MSPKIIFLIITITSFSVVSVIAYGCMNELRSACFMIDNTGYKNYINIQKIAKSVDDFLTDNQKEYYNYVIAQGRYLDLTNQINNLKLYNTEREDDNEYEYEYVFEDDKDEDEDEDEDEYSTKRKIKIKIADLDPHNETCYNPVLWCCVHELENFNPYEAITAAQLTTFQLHFQGYALTNYSSIQQNNYQSIVVNWCKLNSKHIRQDMYAEELRKNLKIDDENETSPTATATDPPKRIRSKRRNRRRTRSSIVIEDEETI